MFEDLTGAELAAALAAAGAAAAGPACLATGDAADPTDPAGPAGPADADDAAGPADPAGPSGAAGGRLGVLVDEVTACDRLIGWATGRQARAVAALGAGYEQHYLADLPAAAAASGWVVGDVRAEAVKDCAVELGLARVTGINAACNLVRFADGLVIDHPRLLAGLEAGQIPVWNIRAVLAETRVLPSVLRKHADVELAPLLPGMSWAEAVQAAARVVIDLDPAAAAHRAEIASQQRSVSVVSGRDGMAGLWANLPAEQTQACWHALDDRARGLKADGDPRNLRHLMCDTLVERVTGLSRAENLPVRVDVAVCASTLAGVDTHPAQLRGYGPIPAPTLRGLLGGDDVVLRRLVTDPVDDHVLAVDSKQRFYRGELRDLIFTIDPICVVPGCDRPAVQVDHAKRHADGGPTSPANALGACTRHNLAHEHPGHQLQIINPDGDARHGDHAGGGGNGGGPGRPGEIWWITLARKAYKLHHPPALGPGATSKPRLQDRRPPQPPMRQ
jgi:hypothetical protein